MNAQEIKSKYCIDYNPILGREFSGGRKEFDKELGEKRYEGLYKQIDFYLKKYAKEKSLSPVQKQDLNRLVKEISAYGLRGARWVNEVKKTIKDSVDVEDAKNKILVYKVFKSGSVVSEGIIGDVNNIPWNELRLKANSSGKKWDTISVFRKGERKAIDFIHKNDARIKDSVDYLDESINWKDPAQQMNVVRGVWQALRSNKVLDSGFGSGTVLSILERKSGKKIGSVWVDDDGTIVIRKAVGGGKNLKPGTKTAEIVSEVVKMFRSYIAESIVAKREMQRTLDRNKKMKSEFANMMKAMPKKSTYSEETDPYNVLAKKYGLRREDVIRIV